MREQAQEQVNVEPEHTSTADAPRDGHNAARLWHRAGAITGVLWSVALIVALLSTRSVQPTWFYLIPGSVVLWLVGRGVGLQGPSSWLLAGALAAIVSVIISGSFAFFWTLSGAYRG